jgi:twitching motility two-component system response regulator PilH
MKGFIPESWFGKAEHRKNQSGNSSLNASDYTILVVDDSRTQLFALRQPLEKSGFNVITAENGKYGILAARHKKPDLILMDIVMPEVNGFQATRYLTRHPDTSHIPIIIISGSNQEADKAWGLKLGARDFITKPVDANQLLTKVVRQLQAADKARQEEPAVHQHAG